MKLNPDCVRDLLLGIERIVKTGRVTYFFSSYEDIQEELSLSAYSTEEIEYHLQQCDLNGLLVSAKFGGDGNFRVRDISPKAHELLAKIRDPEIWNAAKDVAASIRDDSMSTICAAAEKVSSDRLNAYFSQPHNT